MSCQYNLEESLRLKYGEKFTVSALARAHREMEASCSEYARLYNLYWQTGILYKLLFMFWNIFDSYHQMQINRIKLAERLIRIGEVEWMSKIPDTIASYQWITWHRYKIENNSDFY